MDMGHYIKDVWLLSFLFAVLHANEKPADGDQDSARDCVDVLRYLGQEEGGIYNVTLWKSKQRIQVLCDMETDGGGWTVFQQRFDGTLDFAETFSVYESGFGDLNSEFWLGLKYIQEMAAIGETDLRLDMKALDGTDLYELFHNFSLSQAPDYRLHIQPGSGTIGDDSKHGLSYHTGSAFSTLDHDVSPGHCPHYQKGGWWYKSCGYINFNAHHDMKMFYTTSHGYESLKETRMMLRRTSV
ncbi:angiopoietin-2-like isoform X2 [Mercenaria mercenaria]|uniref:angiopoietin-2-like isoform X2 n=1 Tax=Mercenaria mercenaria TaxID=6596 RepID=UPI00234F8C14|nr:angiopoietin-2-like isoform X2 [Mercenaria mercenaria]